MMPSRRFLFQTGIMTVRSDHDVLKDRRYHFRYNPKFRTLESADPDRGRSESVEIYSEGRDHQIRVNVSTGKWW